MILQNGLNTALDNEFKTKIFTRVRIFVQTNYL